MTEWGFDPLSVTIDVMYNYLRYTVRLVMRVKVLLQESACETRIYQHPCILCEWMWWTALFRHTDVPES